MALDRRHFLIGSVLTAAGARAARAADSPQGAIAQDVALLGAPDAALEAKIAALANEAGLYAGFAAVDLVKGQTAFVRGGELFPMLGVRILPIAVAFLSLVQSGAMRFAAQVRLTAADIAPGHSPLASRLRNKATTFTARQLLEHMLLNADATATDALLKLVGGPAKIQNVIKTFDIDGLRVDRFERDLLIDEFGLDAGADYHDAKSLDAAVAAQSEVKRSDVLGRFLRDKRDTASPRAIATLIVRVMSSHLIQPRLAMLLVDLMRRTKLGEDRLKGGLPPGWALGHCIATSRTIQGQTAVFNDAGLATNKKAAKIAMALFIKEAKLSPPELAQFHRAASRAVVDAWR